MLMMSRVADHRPSRAIIAYRYEEAHSTTALALVERGQEGISKGIQSTEYNKSTIAPTLHLSR